MRFNLFAIAALLLAGPALSGEPEFQYPLVKGYGGIVALPEAVEPPRADSKILIDLISDEKKGEVFKGLDRAAVIANLYAQAGVGPSATSPSGLKLAVVIHGAATKSALSDEAYARRNDGANNPNGQLVRRLRQAGVELYVCGQALARQGYDQSEVSSDITVAVSAAVVHINKQMDGYLLAP